MRQNGTMTIEERTIEDGPTGIPLVPGLIPAGQPGAPARRRPRRYWSWLVVLIIFIVLVGGGIGGLALSNVLSRDHYATTIAQGDSVAVLTIPRFGADYEVPILQGTSLATLRRGVGWYDGSTALGQLGNFALTGHRLGWGQPFAQLDELTTGDDIYVTQGQATYHYSVITPPLVITAQETSVLAAVPGQPGSLPTKSLLTLTTAAGLLPSPDRLVVIAELTS